MNEHYLKRRPTWYRYGFFMGIIIILYVATKIKDYQMGWTTGGVPYWAPLFIGALFTFAAMTEMTQTVRWNERSIRMFPRWGFNYLGYKTLKVAVAEITRVRDCQLSIENLKGLPFTAIEITDGETAIPIRTENFFREEMQKLVADIVRLRPDLDLTDNLRGYVQGEFDGYWPK